jgi:glycerate 2-kinase
MQIRLSGGEPTPRQRLVLQILEAALRAVDPAEAVRRFVRVEDETLIVADRRYDLGRFRRIFVVGAGKAGAPMARALEEILGERITGGVVNVKYGHVDRTTRVELNEAAHPVPDEAGLRGTSHILELVRGAGEDDLIFCCISGGGSALLTLPVEGITLADKQALTQALLRSGATINEINTIRKHLSQVKGGRLAQAAYPATLISLILSDVVGSPLDFIASGPTVPDTTTFQDAYDLLQRYGLWEQVPESIRHYIESGVRGLVPETPKPGDPIFARTQVVLVGSNELAAEAAQQEAERLGFHTLILTNYLEGEAREVGRVAAAIARELQARGRPLPAPACVIASGETTVTVRGSGKGGRNQELALAAALALRGVPDVLVLASATDGSDFLDDVAGGLVDGTTVERGAALGLDARAALANNDAYNFLEPAGALLRTGPTNTNVNDLLLICSFVPQEGASVRGGSQGS